MRGGERGAAAKKCKTSKVMREDDKRRRISWFEESVKIILVEVRKKKSTN